MTTIYAEGVSQSRDEAPTATDLMSVGKNPFERLESNVRFYCNVFRAVFTKAVGSTIWSEDGTRFIDFLSGAGALNYGHNNGILKSDLLEYLRSDGITHSLDMHTSAKREFLITFDDVIAKPRFLDYQVQFVGPTGTNAVEAALKLSRKLTGRAHLSLPSPMPFTAYR